MLWILVTVFATVQAAVVTDYESNVDPTKIMLPNIPQLTSLDPTSECQYYYAPEYPLDLAEWPTPWEIATSNGMNASQEFLDLFNSIDWNAAPKTPTRAVDANGAIIMAGYDVANDPDCWWTATGCMKPKASGVFGDIYACPKPRTLGLTYDDGPNCSHNAFYDFLQKNNQSATMFYIGSNVLAWPYGALRGVKDGHQIAGHTWSHRLMTTLSNQEVIAELYYTQKAIKFITGLTPIHWRPAQGDIDDRVRWIATQLGLTAVLWNLDTNDWRAGYTAGITPDTVRENYKEFSDMGKNGTFSQSGGILLAHEINNMTMEFAVEYYPQLKSSYAHVLNVATCMNINNPYVEQTVSFPNFTSATGDSVTQDKVAPPGQSAPVSAANDIIVSKTMYIVLLVSVVLFV